MNRKTLEKFRSFDDLKDLPQLDEREVSLLWHVHWFDGPLNGMILHRGQCYWFDLCFDDDEGVCTIHLVFPLTDIEAKRAEAWDAERKAFSQKPELLRQQEIQNELDHEEAAPDFSDREPIAWFSSGHNKAFYGMQVFDPPSTE